MFRLIVLFCLACAAPVLAPGQPVDLELVLSVGSSGSIDGDEFGLQREGYARALTYPEIIRAITSGPYKSIALTFIKWSGPGITTKVVGWTRIAGKVDAEALAAQLLAAPRTIFGGGTSLGAAASGDAPVTSTVPPPSASLAISRWISSAPALSMRPAVSSAMRAAPPAGGRSASMASPSARADGMVHAPRALTMKTSPYCSV